MKSVLASFWATWQHNEDVIVPTLMIFCSRISLFAGYSIAELNNLKASSFSNKRLLKVSTDNKSLLMETTIHVRKMSVGDAIFERIFNSSLKKILRIKSYYVMDDDCRIDRCNEVDCE